MTNTCFELTLVYKDGSTWFAGGFKTQEDLDRWLKVEQSKTYWDASTVAHITEKTSKVDE